MKLQIWILLLFLFVSPAISQDERKENASGFSHIRNDAKAFFPFDFSQSAKADCNKYILELLVFIYSCSLQ